MTHLNITDLNTMWNNLLEHQIVSDETLQIITSINGHNISTLNDVLYAVTGYHTWDQYLEGAQGWAE